MVANPSASGSGNPASQDVEDHIDNLAHLPLPTPAAWTRRGQKRRQEQPFRVGHVTFIA